SAMGARKCDCACARVSRIAGTSRNRSIRGGRIARWALARRPEVRRGDRDGAGQGPGLVLELAAVGARLVIRRLRKARDEVLVVEGGVVKVVRGELNTRMEPYVAVGDDAIAIATDEIEIFGLVDAAVHRLPISGKKCVLGLSPDGRTLAVAHR